MEIRTEYLAADRGAAMNIPPVCNLRLRTKLYVYFLVPQRLRWIITKDPHHRKVPTDAPLRRPGSCCRILNVRVSGRHELHSI